MRLVQAVDMELNETLQAKVSKNDAEIVKLGFMRCPACEVPIEKVN